MALPHASDGVASPSARSPLAPSPVRSTNGETGTNVQEAGVDEPDVVKTDGHTLFRIQDGDLVTYDLSGAEVERLTSLDLPGAPGADGTELLLSGDTVVALSQRSTGESGRTVTHLTTVDVSDPAAPDVTHTVDYDGALVTARLHDGVVRVVLQAALPDLDFTVPNKTTTEYEATEANQAAVRASTIEDWLPTSSLDGAEEAPLLGCDQVAIPDDSAALGTMAVVGFDASAPDAPSVTGLAVATDLVYASTDQLYLATSPSQGVITGGCFDCWESPPMPMPESDSWLPGWLGGGDSGDGVSCCTPLPTPPGGYDDASHLYAFDLDGIDTTFAASGQVDGAIRDRWSMDAVGGGDDAVLRVAVGPNSEHRQLQLGRHLPPGGQRPGRVRPPRPTSASASRSSRSAGSTPSRSSSPSARSTRSTPSTSPTPTSRVLMGSLKIPGFSAYLHPLGEHRLLGLGQRPGRGRQLGRAGRLVRRHRPHPPAAARRRGLRPGQPGARRPGPAPAHLAARRPHRAHRVADYGNARQRRLRLGAEARRRHG